MGYSGRTRGRWFVAAMGVASVVYPVVLCLLFVSTALFPRKISLLEPWSDPAIRHAFVLGILTSVLSACFAVLVAVPSGYALSRWRFPGYRFMDIILYLPIALPPLVVGVALLIFFQTIPGRWIEGHVLAFTFSPPGIVLAQSVMAGAFAVRVMKLAFDGISPDYARVARTLGASRWKAFRYVEMGAIRGGILEAFVLAWAVAIGCFGPVTLFCGITRLRTEVLSSSIFLEFSVGNLDRALVLSIWMGVLTGCVLIVARGWRKGPLW